MGSVDGANEENQKSDESPALRARRHLRKHDAGTAIERLIEMARMALAVPNVDANGQPMLVASVLPVWNWHLPVPKELDCGPLKSAVTEVWDQVHLADDDLCFLAGGMLWASCVVDQEFLRVWNELATEQTGSRGDSLKKFKQELVRFIYRYLSGIDVYPSPLHYAALRNSGIFQEMHLDMLSCISDKAEYFKYICWSPRSGLAYGYSADCCFDTQSSEDSFPLLLSYLQQVGTILESSPIASVRSRMFDICHSWERSVLDEYAPLPVLFCLAVQEEGNFFSHSSFLDLAPGFIRNYLLATSSPSHKLTPLQVAVIAGNTTAVKWLLKLHGKVEVNITALDCGKRTALHWALYKRNEEIVKLLVEHAADTKQPLNAAVEDCDDQTPVETAMQWDWSGNTEVADFLLKVPDVERQIDKRYRDRQVYVDAANAKLVGAALIASVTFAGWLQPPLGYVQYDQFPADSSISPSPDDYKSFAAIEQELRVKAFWVLNCLSFFFAMATVLTGAGSVLPREDLFITAAVRRLNRWLMATSVLLPISVVCGLGAFTAAGLAALPPVLSLELYMIVPAAVGLMICFIIVLGYVRGILQVFIVRYKSKQRRKFFSGCKKEEVETGVRVLRRRVEQLQLLGPITTMARLQYLHSVAVQIDGKMKQELREKARADMDKIDKKYNDEVGRRMKCCIATTREDVNCNFIEVREGSFRFADDEKDMPLFEHFRQKRAELEATIDFLSAKLYD